MKFATIVALALACSACNLFDPAEAPPDALEPDDGANSHTFPDVRIDPDATASNDMRHRDAGSDSGTSDASTSDSSVPDLLDDTGQSDMADSGVADMQPDLPVDMPPDVPPDMPPIRVTSGVVALWNFADYTAGNGVPDATGVAPPAQLTRTAGTVTATPDGAMLDGDGALATTTPPTKIHTAMADGDFTIEIWLTAASAVAGLERRLFTMSQDIGGRNISLLQDGDVLVVRLRTDDASLNGDGGGGEVITNGYPFREVPGLAWAAQMHLVLTMSSGVLTVYADAMQVGQWNYGNAGFTNWDNSFNIMFGNEFDGLRPWAGTLHLAAIYDQALSPTEIATNMAAGLP